MKKPRTRNEINAQRLANLQRLILKVTDDNNIAQFARMIDRPHAYVHQLVTGGRSVGEQIARHIEAKLNLPYGSLDLPEKRTVRERRQLYIHYSPDIDQPLREFRACPEVTWDELKLLSSFGRLWLNHTMFRDGDEDETQRKVSWCQFDCGEDTVYVIAKNSALEPLIREGEMVFIDPEIGKGAQHNHLYLVSHQDWAQPELYRCQIAAGQIMLVWTNPDFGGKQSRLTLTSDSGLVVIGECVQTARALR
jgi:hypothetical protein